MEEDGFAFDYQMDEVLESSMLTDADSSDSEVEEDNSECNVELSASGETAFQFLFLEQPNLMYICRKQESFKTSGFMPKYQHC